MQTEKRRKRIEWIKRILRVILFCRRHFKQIAISVILIFVFGSTFLTLYPVKAAEEKGVANIVQFTKNDSEDQAKGSGKADTKERAAPAEKQKKPFFYAYATSHKTDQPVILSDVYAEKDSIVVFKTFYPSAELYTWETFNESIQEWVKIPAEEIAQQVDEINREISAYTVTASEENDNLMIRCTIDLIGKEAVTDMATLHVLDKAVSHISIDDFTAESGQYIHAMDIPVDVTYRDGSKETITGLNGIAFINEETSSEETISVSGNAVETVTTVTRFYEYAWLDTEEQELSIRYKTGETSVGAPVRMKGEDTTEPVISGFTVDDLTVSNTADKPVSVKVMIEASDNCTPYQDLVYAFLPKGKKVEETDWKSSPSFHEEIAQNGIWMAYCRDQAGNIATSEKEIIAIDDKAPEVSLRLEKTDWCRENKIFVEATDVLSMEYCFTCTETGEESGWITGNEYIVKRNGTWKVKVRDAAGNVTEHEIAVDNIDTQAPVIIKITEKEGEATEQ